MTIKEDAEKRNPNREHHMIEVELKRMEYQACAKGESVQALVNKVKQMDCECGGETGSEESYKDGTCLRCEALEAWKRATNGS